MCEVIEIAGRNVCKKTGLPIVMDTPVGLFCDKECGLDSLLFSKSRADQWINDMGPIFEQLKDKK